MKKKLLLLCSFLLVFGAYGCKNDQKDVKNESKVESEQKTENTEKTETNEVSDVDFDTTTEVKLPVSDIKFSTTDVDGKKYVDLAEFQEYMKLSKHRFTYKIDTEKKEISFKEGQYPKEKSAAKVDATGLSSEDFTLKLKGKKVENAKVILKDKNNALVDLMSMSRLMEFSLDADSNLVFKDADNLKAEVSNNRDYDWYYDQAHTGKCSDGNCGPTSLSMILKWLNKDSTATGESLRNEIPNNGDWWTTNIFDDYFKNHSEIKVKDALYTGPEMITDMLNDGNIVLVCIKMGEIAQNKTPDESNIGRFYDFDGGHFLLIKGYKIIDGKLYYEVYDPNNWDSKYSQTGEPMGKDRLYPAEEMARAITTWWSGIYGIK